MKRITAVNYQQLCVNKFDSLGKKLISRNIQPIKNELLRNRKV